MPCWPRLHAEAVELRSVEQLGEDAADLLGHDAGPLSVTVTMKRSAWATDGPFGASTGASPSLTGFAFASALGPPAVALAEAGASTALRPPATSILTSISGGCGPPRRRRGVVDGFLDGREEGFAGAVEAQEVPVLGEELRDGDFALFLGHVLRGDAVDGGACPRSSFPAGDGGGSLTFLSSGAGASFFTGDVPPMGSSSFATVLPLGFGFAAFIAGTGKQSCRSYRSWRRNLFPGGPPLRRELYPMGRKRQGRAGNTFFMC